VSWVIEHHASVDSTMRLAAQRPVGAVVVADEQTAGQGRHGHSWHSAAGDGLYCSIVLEPRPVLTLALGLATVDAIASVTGITCDLRWPNDVMIGARKVAGILVQLVDGRAIAGIGINVNHERFPVELEHLATSLRIHGGSPVSIGELLDALLRSVEAFASENQDNVLRLFTQASSYVSGRRVTVDLPDGTIIGTTAGMDADGYLRVQQDDGTVTLVLAGGVRAAGS